MKTHLNRLFRAFVAIAFSIAVGQLAHASPLVPGATIPSLPEPDPVGGALVAGGVPVPFATGGPAPYSGTLITTVLAGDVSNPFGGLTFTYQLHNDATSLSALERLTNIDFTGYLTDVSYQVPTAGLPPTSTDRDPSASTVGWNFSPLGLGAIVPGATSALLVIQTDAHSFVPINANIIDGAVTPVASFGPAPVPEPASLALLGIGTMLSLRRRRA